MIIDIHTHPVMIEELTQDDPGLEKAVKDVFGLYMPAQPLDTFKLEMKAAGITQAVLLPIDCITSHNCIIVSNQQVAKLVNENPEFIGFASVDPFRNDAKEELREAVRQLGLRGLKLDPALQGFYPNDKENLYPLYSLCCDLDIPVLMHCGLSWAPKGVSKKSQPIYLEEVVQSFPQLNLIIPHFGWPWVAETVMLALKHRNVFIDTSVIFSGTPADALQHVVVQQIGKTVLERSLRGQILFGSNYPRVDMRRSVRGIYELELSAGFEHKIFHENTAGLLNMEGSL